LYAPIGYSLGMSVSDIWSNNDSWDDIYISNDFFEQDCVHQSTKQDFKEKLKMHLVTPAFFNGNSIFV
jgi:hypothetical protein